MTVQTKSLIVGAASLATAKYYFGKDWKTAALISAAAIVAFLVVTDLPGEDNV